MPAAGASPAVSFRRPSLTVQIFAAMALGVAAGAAGGRPAAALGELGRLVIQLIKAAAAPLLFLSIVRAIARTEVGMRSAGRMVAIATVNASIALVIGLAVSNVLQPGRHLPAAAFSSAAATPSAGALDLSRSLAGLVPRSVVEPFAENNILALVVLGLLLGFALRRGSAELPAREGYRVLESALEALLAITQTVLGWIIRLVPLAVFGVVASAVGQYGLAPLRGLAAYVAAGLIGLAIQSLVTYQAWLAGYVGMPLRRFWREAREPVVYAAGANSSLATLPLTLRTLSRLGVSEEAAALGACIGTNLNNDGIILYEAMAVLFVAQAHGLSLTLGQQAAAALTCLVSAAGIAGVPEAGFVSLSLVLATVGLPLDLLPLLLTVDWILARGRSVVNVLSDLLTSIILDRWERAN